MAYEFLSYIFCCCSHKGENYDITVEQDDETTRLIPDNLESSIYSDPALINQHRMQERLDSIVRAKERKMVNVGSRIPFNLHNRVLSPKVDHSLSRNPSTVSDYFDSADAYGEGMHYGQQSNPSALCSRFSISASPDSYRGRSQSSSKSVERESQTPILNVRLVGYVNRRGRTMCRNESTVAGDSTAADSTPTASTLRNLTGNPSPSTTGSPIDLKLHEVGAIYLSWGD